MKKIRVIIWGLGAMGGGIAKLAAQKPELEIVGGIVRHTRGAQTLREYLQDPNCPQVPIGEDPTAILARTEADLMIVATSSFTRDVYSQIELALQRGINVITIAEQMANPWVDEPRLAAQLDAMAKSKGVCLVGTGINPGFVLDCLIIALTAVCTDIKHIKAARINDLSPFGPTVMATQGVGTTPEEFANGLANGTIVGHIGFRESMTMIANALGWHLDEIRETREPILSQAYRETPHVKVAPGNVAGCRHIAHGYVNGKVRITLEHPQQVRPEAEGVDTGDYIWIEGTPPINLAIKPEIPGGIGTIAMAVNLIPLVMQASPGLKTMTDLPVPRALLGDIASINGLDHRE